MTQPVKYPILPPYPSSPLQQVKNILNSDENTQARHVAAASGTCAFIREAARSPLPIGETVVNITKNLPNYGKRTGSLMFMVYLEQATTAHIAKALQEKGFNETTSKMTALCIGSITGAVMDPLTIDRRGPIIKQQYCLEIGNAFVRNNLSIAAFFFHPFENNDGPTNALLKQIYPGTVFAVSRVSDCIGLSLSEKLFNKASKPISYSRMARCVALSFVYGNAVANIRDMMQQRHQ
ncbi:hypothetical protein CL658_01130 [bacterium]|nr:hypothetical protein [bacterium]|tara:strand:- start:3969 stop:4676 length:708 start_codon:yes stop_codon:yes gene_type:complete